MSKIHVKIILRYKYMEREEKCKMKHHIFSV